MFKRILSLFIALILICSLSVMAADFSDSKEIDYFDAVTVMNGLGIIQGDDNDGDGQYEFRPKDFITRAEATKLITYLLLGDNAEKLPTYESIFSDVPNDSWALKYINFCAARGIVKGRGNDIFDPKGNITGVELAVILLRTVGYGAKGEYEGASWKVNATVDALNYGVFENANTYDYDTAATREETALYFFNTLLNIYQVYIDVNVNNYVSTRNTLAETVWNLDWIEAEIIGNQATGEEYTVTDKGSFDLETSLDVVGHQVKIWYKDSVYSTKNVQKAYVYKDLSSTISAGKTYGDIYKAFFEKNKSNVNVDLSTIPYWENYKKVSTTLPSLIVNDLKDNTTRHDLSGTFVFDKSGNVTYYFTTSYTVDLIQSISKDEIKLKNTSYKVPNIYDFAKGDFVTVKVVGNRVYLEPTTTKIVTISEKSLQNAGCFNYNDITPGKYNNKVPFVGINFADVQVGDTVCFYLDSEGKYFGIEPVEPGNLSGIVFVAKSWSRDTINTFGEKTTKYYAQCVTENGDEIIYDNVTSVIVAPGVFKVYSQNEKISLLPLENSTLTKEKDKAASLIDNGGHLYYITDDTSVYYINGEGSNLSITSAKSLLRDDAGSYFVNYYRNNVKTVWIIGTAPVVYENDYIFIKETTPLGIIDINNIPYYYYDAYINGIYYNDLVISSETDLTSGFYKYSLKDGIYFVDNSTVTNVTSTLFDKTAIYNGYLYYDADGISLEKISVVDTVNNETMTISEFEYELQIAENPISVTYVYTKSNVSNIPVKVIYITKW